MSDGLLVRPLFEGPIDVIGDVHGEIDALRDLLRKLEYSCEGIHPDGRRLVFVGDLTDRGPDSPAVVALVQMLVESGRAQCVLGNHDLNILLGKEKDDNDWFYGRELHVHGTLVPQVLADESTRGRLLEFFRGLPLVLERKDVRIVHACWDGRMVAINRSESNTVELYNRYAQRIRDELSSTGSDEIDRNLQLQNRNPVKLLTSGPERRAREPFVTGKTVRHEERVPWWDDYRDEPYCVFGHYSNGGFYGNGRAICVDFGVGRRAEERLALSAGERSRYALAAVRLPERTLVKDQA